MEEKPILKINFSKQSHTKLSDNDITKQINRFLPFRASVFTLQVFLSFHSMTCTLNNKKLLCPFSLKRSAVGG